MTIIPYRQSNAIIQKALSVAGIILMLVIGISMVGIYIGNGKTIEAHSPSRGISYGSLSSFVSCGSPCD